MNQPSENVPLDITAINSSLANQPGLKGPFDITNGPLQNLFHRLAKSGADRQKTRGAFGGKARAKRHQGRV
jgi:hypothetical protein